MRTWPLIRALVEEASVTFAGDLGCVSEDKGRRCVSRVRMSTSTGGGAPSTEETSFLAVASNAAMRIGL